VPIVVPPVDYADLEGVQLGEQAIWINSFSGLDELRDSVAAALNSQVPSALWNEHKTEFLNRWDTEFSQTVPSPKAVPAEALEEADRRLAAHAKELGDLRATVARLSHYSKSLAAQNDELRSRVQDAPPPPELEGDENAYYIAEAENAIDRASQLMAELPEIVREALFHRYRDGQALTVGGFNDRFTVDMARTQVELGRLNWLENEEQQVHPRVENPAVGKADDALARVREAAFDGTMMSGTSEAGDWIKPFLKERYGIVDPVFELRPVGVT
jgi:hypothetical protein